MTLPVRDRVAGVLLGTAVGDACGVPFEGLAPERVANRLARRPLVPYVVSDDTEHTALVARALVRSGGDPLELARQLARGLRRWLWALPPMIGWGTLRGLVRSCLGWSPATSGVRSPGSGPAMRAALLGVVGTDDHHVRALVAASSRITHRDPRAEDAALAIARAARTGDPEALGAIARQCRTREVGDAIAAVAAAARLGLDLSLHGWSRGVPGYCVDVVAAATWVWATSPTDGRAAVERAVRLGGDTDTVAAIAGALVGATAGPRALPAAWRRDALAWPLTIDYLDRLADAVVGGELPRDRTLIALPRNLVVGLRMLVLAARHLAWR
jgi:ADP-ribosylglycohydrolase